MSEITNNGGFDTLRYSTTASKVPQENAFNFLRLVCCFVVIYEHCVVLSGASLPCFNLRGIAVNVFFILSGFWVTLSYLKSSSIKKYAFKRFRKIFPEYWTVVILCAVLLSFFSSLSFRDYFSNSGFYKYLLANILTLNFVHPTLPGVFENMALDGSVNGSLWTIKVELGFYIVLPFLVWAMRKLNGSRTKKCHSELDSESLNARHYERSEAISENNEKDCHVANAPRNDVGVSGGQMYSSNFCFVRFLSFVRGAYARSL